MQNRGVLGMKLTGTWVKMDDLTHAQSHDGMLKTAARVERQDVTDAPPESSNSAQGERDGDAGLREGTGRRTIFGRKKKSYSRAHFKVYKRRWLGLGQLVLLNIVVSWDVCTLISSSAFTVAFSRRCHPNVKSFSTKHC